MKSGTRRCNPVHSKEKSDLESRTILICQVFRNCPCFSNLLNDFSDCYYFLCCDLCSVPMAPYACKHRLLGVSE
jgi:hypothetical protein